MKSSSCFPYLYSAILFTLLTFASAYPGEAVKDRSGGDEGKKNVELRVGIPKVGSPRRVLYDEFLKRNPDISFVQSGGISIAGTGADAGFFMSMAGGTAPDIFYVGLENIETYYMNNFLYPLDKLDQDSGKLLNTIRDSVKNVLVKNGHVYGMPENYKAHCLVYNKELFRKVNLPLRGPDTWEEFFEFALKLHDPEAGVSGYALYGGAWLFTHRLWEAGGNYFVFGAVNPENGVFTPSSYSDPVLPEKCRVTGRPFVKGQDRIVIRSLIREPEFRKAVNFDRRLLFCRWAKDRKGEKLLFRDVDIATGKFIEKNEAAGSDGRAYKLSEDGKEAVSDDFRSKIYTGVVLYNPTPHEDFQKGRVGMMLDASGAGRDGRLPDFNQSIFSIAPTPIGPSGKRVTVSNAGLWCVNSQIPPERMNAAWRFLEFFCGEESRNIKTRELVENGEGSYVLPEYLKAAGFDDYIDDVPKDWIKTSNEMNACARSNPNVPGWLIANRQITEMLEYINTNPDLNVGAEIDSRSNYVDKIFAHATGETKSEKMAWPLKALCTILIIMLFGTMAWLLIKVGLGSAEGKARLPDDIVAPPNKKIQFSKLIMPCVFMAPAVLAVLIFCYYPLLRGTLIAFYDYKIIGESTFVGIDNFVNVIVSKEFWWSMYVTVKYMLISLTIGFTIPILVALALDEIPWGKTFFRTIFYLPAVTSGLVIMLLWKEMYDPTPAGILNQCMAYLGLGPFQFLKDPNLALLCLVIPAAWAHAGPGCIIYLAALKCVPAELYEAAAIDGARWYHKLRYVTLPTLFPLVLINFIGAFLGAMQGMGDILVMTGGGPDRATQVVALEIFYNAYVYMKFGYAIAIAWVLSAILLGVTALKMRLIKKVDFKSTEGN